MDRDTADLRWILCSPPTQNTLDHPGREVANHRARGLDFLDRGPIHSEFGARLRIVLPLKSRLARWREF
jgi:hypothetical protein